jgi:simple sugar transport system permease protein
MKNVKYFGNLSSAVSSTKKRYKIVDTLSNFVVYVFREHLIWLILAILILYGTGIPGFSSTVNITNVMWAAAPLGCMVLAMFFVMLTGGLDLSIESIFGFAPTIALMALLRWYPDTVTPLMAVIITPIVGGLAGLVNGIIAVKMRVNPFLVTLATLLIMRGYIVYLIPEGIYYLPEEYTYLGRVKLFEEWPIAIFVLIILYILAYIITNHYSLGKNIYAIGNNEEAAYIAGINVHRTKIITFVLAGVVAAIGGLLETGRLQSIVADMGEGDILMVFAGAILGGTAMTGGGGRVTGIFGAVLVLAIIGNLMNLEGIEPSIRQIVFGVILLLAIIVSSFQERMQKAA